MAALFLSVFSLDLALAALTRTSGLCDSILKVIAGVAVFALAYGYSRWRAMPKMQHICVFAAWIVVMTYALATLVQLAGRFSSPLVDAELAALDAAFAFSTEAVVAFMAKQPLLQGALSIIYDTLLLLMVVPLFAPVFFDDHGASQRYILSVTIAAVLTAALFALWPAVGPWDFFHFEPTKEQAQYQRYLFSVLRFNGRASLDINSSGVVTFPSFHAVLALLAMISLWRIRVVKYVVAFLAVGICVSTMTTGWHYLADVIGGIVIVVVSHGLAAKVMAALGRAEDHPAKG